MNPERIWQYLDVCVADGEVYLNACWESGACGIEEDKPVPGCYRVYFPDEASIEKAQKRLAEVNESMIGSLSVTPGSISDPGWRTAWHQFFVPTPVGDRFLVLPSWETIPEANRICLKIHPGQAFGTGYHETTALCLEMMEKEVFTECSILDAGCGSGVLGIAAALLGAQSVTGVDVEEEAVTEAHQNAEMNHVSEKCQWINQKVESVVGLFDFVLANLNIDLIRSHHLSIINLLKPNGKLILSGFLTMDSLAVQTLFNGVTSSRILCTKERGEWSCALMIRI